MELLEIDLGSAEVLLHKSGGSVKLAIAMHWLNCGADEANKRLADADGFLSRLR